MKTKELMKKGKIFIIAIWGRKELWIDGGWILAIIAILIGIPAIYNRITPGVGRVVFAAVFFGILLAMMSWVIIRLIKRNKQRNLEKKDFLLIILRSITVAVVIWIFACVMVKMIHPSLTGIYVVEMSQFEKNSVLIFNSLFFFLCSQAFLTIFTGIEERGKFFYKRLLKTWGITFIPMFLLTALFTLLIEWIKDIDLFISNFFNTIFTTLLWVTSIAINERIKRGR